MRMSRELQIGKAGEYLTCVDLIMKGFVAFPSEQGLPYDVLLDNGKRLIRVQVKTCEKPREIPQRNTSTFAYMFNVKNHGKNRKAIYGDDEVDVFSLVALDTREVGYIIAKDIRQSINFRVDALRGTYYDEKGKRDYENVMEIKRKNPDITQVAIAKQLGLQIAVVNRMFQPNFVPYETKAKYFSDIFRSSEWFREI